MALTRLFIRGELRPGVTLPLDPEQAHYLGRVLRLRPGESLRVFNSESGEFAAVIERLA
jgi:16S rRNA (uracil1498-N3)-methyltransferase